MFIVLQNLHKKYLHIMGTKYFSSDNIINSKFKKYLKESLFAIF